MLKCFFVTNIKVAGTIVTYEIVLIQFNSVNSEVNDQNKTIIYCP